ncbi:hypothetical protein MRX96_045291 [Rhipicephalus microplus]
MGQLARIHPTASVPPFRDILFPDGDDREGAVADQILGVVLELSHSLHGVQGWARSRRVRLVAVRSQLSEEGIRKSFETRGDTSPVVVLAVQRHPYLPVLIATCDTEADCWTFKRL